MNCVESESSFNIGFHEKFLLFEYTDMFEIFI